MKQKWAIIICNKKFKMCIYKCNFIAILWCT